MVNAHDVVDGFLRLDGVTKRYGGTTALKDISFSAARGSIHAILGENGAGKSTLMKILAGVVKPDSGTITLGGSPLSMSTPSDALETGVVCIFQELSLVPHLTVAENICIRKPPRRYGLVDGARQNAEAAKVLAEMGFEGEFNLSEHCSDLSLSRRQIIEIAKAVIQRPRVLILDEATSALAAGDVNKILSLLRRLREDGVCVLFISHRMHEIDALADMCSVFRSGERVASFPAGTRSHEDIVKLMIGRPIAQVYPPKPEAASLHPAYLRLAGLSWNNVLKGIDLQVRPGEIVGLGGLDGQGQRELLLALSGVLANVEGEIHVGERLGVPASPKAGKGKEFQLAFVPEERKTEGLFIRRSVADNLSVAALSRFTRRGAIEDKAEKSMVMELVNALQIKAPDLSSPVATLSGGNQQKVLLGKWLATQPRLLLLMDPTRGVDVGTKQEIYRLFRDLAEKGTAILLYSSDYDELIGLCDRVAVIYDGQVRSVLSGASLNEQQILMDSMNLSSSGSAQSPASVSQDVQLGSYAR